MCLILVSVLMSALCVVHCEWIEISQPIRKSNEITSNRSLVMSNAEIPANFDFSTYKDFFSIIEPNIDYVKHVEPFHKNTVHNFTLENKLKNKDYHILMDSPESVYDQTSPATTQRTQLLLEPPNVSKLSVFSGFSDSQDKLVTNPLKVDSLTIKIKNPNDKVKNESDNKNRMDTKEPINNEQVKGSEQLPANKGNRIVYKRVELKPFDFNGVLKFFANMQQSFPMDSFASIRDKIMFLENFKDNLVENIEERFKMIWPASASQGKHRVRRYSSGGHVMSDFPSSETALMTISFLTLAVFLIKLVLQVIHTIKSKHVGLQTMTPPTANEAPIKIIQSNRNARRFSLSTADDLRAVTEAISSIEKNVNAYT